MEGLFLGRQGPTDLSIYFHSQCQLRKHNVKHARCLKLYQRAHEDVVAKLYSLVMRQICNLLHVPAAFTLENSAYEILLRRY